MINYIYIYNNVTRKGFCMKAGLLDVKVCATRDEMGAAAAKRAGDILRKVLSEKEEANVIFAAAPSQNETLAHLVEERGIDWTRVNAFHMDEYVGLPFGHPARFSQYLAEHIFDLVPFRRVFRLGEGNGTPEEECRRYEELLKEYPTDLVCLGIGENGHIAFNDPGVADFRDPVLVKLAALDDVCRQQQVNDGCFPTIDDVPTHALTLTIPALTAAKHLVCTVPGKTKTAAVTETVLGREISERCPATIMRRHPSATLYCDYDSAAGIL